MGKRITVIGATNMDIRGECTTSLVPGDSNIGIVSSSLGGVGHNIALNLSLLGEKVEFITALGCGVMGESGRRELEERMDISHSLFTSSPGGVYLYVTDSSGEMILAVNDMRINDEITREFILSRRDVIERSDYLVLDANIPQSSLLQASLLAGGIVAADAVSTQKVDRLRPAFPYIDILKPNVMELGYLSGRKISDERTLLESARVILDEGVKALLVTAGRKGAYYIDNKNAYHCGVMEGKVKNTNGAGDAFLAAFIASLSRGQGRREALRLSSSLSSLSTQCDKTVSKIDWSLVEEKAKEIRIEEIS